MTAPDSAAQYDPCPRCGRDMLVGSSLCPACEARAARRGEGSDPDQPRFVWLRIVGVVLGAILISGCVLATLFLWLAGF